MAAGCLLLNEAGELLLVNPVYRPHWLLPGGVVEADESPRTACRREVQEELGLQRPSLRLLCVDYVAGGDGRTESLQFIFAGGVLTADEVSLIQLPTAELSAVGFWEPAAALSLLSPRSTLRVQLALTALQNGTAVYLENGRLS